MNLIDVTPTTGELGLANAARVRPGAKESSVLWERLRRADGTAMPPIAHHVPDPFGVELIGYWIDSGAN